MKNITKIGAALVAALAAASTIAWSGPGGGAITQWDTGVIPVDVSGFEVPCVAEPLRILGNWPYKRHEVWTPSGGHGYKFQFTPITPNGGSYVLIGETTGKVYRAQNGMPANEVFRLGPGEIYSFRSHERYVADDGDTLIIDWHVRLTTNPNGVLTVDQFKFTCR